MLYRPAVRVLSVSYQECGWFSLVENEFGAGDSGPEQREEPEIPSGITTRAETCSVIEFFPLSSALIVRSKAEAEVGHIDGNALKSL